MSRDKYPERVPFRLTRMLTNAMEVCGIEGSFRHTCESVMNVMRQQRDSVVAMLEAFVHDPLITWRLAKSQAIPDGPSFAYSLPVHSLHTRRDRVASLTTCCLHGTATRRAAPLGPGVRLSLPWGWDDAGLRCDYHKAALPGGMAGGNSTHVPGPCDSLMTKADYLDSMLATSGAAPTPRTCAHTRACAHTRTCAHAHECSPCASPSAMRLVLGPAHFLAHHPLSVWRRVLPIPLTRPASSRPD